MQHRTVGYTYSSDFPQRSRARIAAVKIEAGLELEDSKRQLRWVSDLEAEIRKYILRVFIVFVEEAMELGRQRRWSVDRIDEQARKFLECTTFEAEREKGYFQSGRGMRIESLVDRVFSDRRAAGDAGGGQGGS